MGQVLTPKSSELFISQPSSWLPLRCSIRKNCQDKLSRTLEDKYKFIKSCFTLILLEFMNFLKIRTKYMFSWNIVKMESFFTTLIRKDLSPKSAPLRFLNRSYRPWNTWNFREFFTETSNAKTFFSIQIGTPNLWILDLPQKNKTGTLAELFVGLPHTLLLK